MDLIYTDRNGIDQGILLSYSLDMEIGGKEDFELKVPISNYFRIESGSFIYVQNSDIFGRIEGIKVATKDHTITYSGRTIRGILDTKVIQPEAGQDYRIVSGTLEDILNSLVSEFAMSDLIEFKDEVGKTLTSYQIDRYVTMLDFIDKVLKDFAMCMEFDYADKMIVHIVQQVDYVDQAEFGVNVNVNFTIEQQNFLVNHLICLGKGELKNRQVVHLYRDDKGNVSQNQYYYGRYEVQQTYDYPSVESTEKLIMDGTKKLQDQTYQSIKVSLPESMIANVGDIVGGTEEITGVKVRAPITQKIIKLTDGDLLISYKVGEQV